MLFDNAMTNFIQFILPQQCLICAKGKPTKDLICHNCQKLLPILTHYCNKCAHPLPDSKIQHANCGHCMRGSVYFDQVFASFYYKPPIIQLIQGLKFSGKLIYGRALAQLMLQDCQNRWPLLESPPDIIIPVPLHPSRTKERGFNQAAELAKPIAKALQCPIDLHSMIRQRATQAQAQQPIQKRRENLHNAFTTKNRFDQQHLLIIDDVVTTGQTVNELAKTARQAGAKHITILCAARTRS